MPARNPMYLCKSDQSNYSFISVTILRIRRGIENNEAYSNRPQNPRKCRKQQRYPKIRLLVSQRKHKNSENAPGKESPNLGKLLKANGIIKISNKSYLTCI